MNESSQNTTTEVHSHPFIPHMWLSNLLTISQQCKICNNHYEVCSSCRSFSTKMKGCVEDKSKAFHDNGGYIKDAEQQLNTGSWLKEKNSDQNKQKKSDWLFVLFKDCELSSNILWSQKWYTQTFKCSIPATKFMVSCC